MNSERVYRMRAADVLDALEKKLARKGRTREELAAVIEWMLGYSPAQLDAVWASEACYGEFFERAPRLNEERMLVRGKVCGVEVSAIADPLMREVRILDKLVDELAKGRPLERVLNRG